MAGSFVVLLFYPPGPRATPIEIDWRPEGRWPRRRKEKKDKRRTLTLHWPEARARDNRLLAPAYLCRKRRRQENVGRLINCQSSFSFFGFFFYGSVCRCKDMERTGNRSVAKARSREQLAIKDLAHLPFPSFSFSLL